MPIVSSRRRRIVIVGGGFAGVLIARQLSRSYSERAEVTLISASDRFVFSPRLIDALGRHEDMTDRFTAFLPDLATRSGFTFVIGLASHVDRNNRTVSVATKDAIVPYPYDLLVLAQGAATAYYNIPGAQEYTMPLKMWDDLKRIHGRVAECITNASNASTDDERRAALSFVFVGGGPSGIESAFALKQHVDDSLIKNPSLIPFVTYTLLQGAPQILTGFPPNMVKGAMNELTSHGFKVRIGMSVSAVERDAVRLNTDERIPSSLTLWTAGVAANVVPMTPEIERDGKGMMVDSTLKIDAHIFAAGDAISARDKQLLLPKNAQTAMQMAASLSKNLMRELDGQPLIPFRFHNLGSIVTLGSTGYINIGRTAIKFPLALQLRDLFYHHRMHQITG
ncbi:MAG: FAD-dependent oxidoreductase [Patescibacteria group bacterium]